MIEEPAKANAPGSSNARMHNYIAALSIDFNLQSRC